MSEHVPAHKIDAALHKGFQNFLELLTVLGVASSPAEITLTINRGTEEIASAQLSEKQAFALHHALSHGGNELAEEYNKRLRIKKVADCLVELHQTGNKVHQVLTEALRHTFARTESYKLIRDMAHGRGENEFLTQVLRGKNFESPHVQKMTDCLESIAFNNHQNFFFDLGKAVTLAADVAGGFEQLLGDKDMADQLYAIATQPTR